MADQANLESRQALYGEFKDGLEVWTKLGVTDPQSIPMLDTADMHALKEGLPA
jgi:hypothetical protein